MDSGIQNTPDLGSVLSGLLSNPTALSSLMSVLGSVTNSQSKEMHEKSEDAPAYSHTDTAPVPESAPVFKSQSIEGIRPFPPTAPACPKDSKEKTLLLALKPFLSRSKCDTLDMFIKLIDIISLVGRIK